MGERSGKLESTRDALTSPLSSRPGRVGRTERSSRMTEGPTAPLRLSADQIRRIRAGDAEAAEQFVREFEPEIRRKVRIWLRLRGAAVASQLESVDVCQSVLAEFFDQAQSGRFDLDRPDRVLGLLVAMARHKLGIRLRDQYRQKRDVRRVGPMVADLIDARAMTPSRILAAREQWETFQEKLDPEERAMADLRGEGLTWAEIADRLGGTAEARRKQWSRVLHRLAAELDIQ
ncbi:RNA polymerase sigma factor [Tundrisphaera sp. TA3]|uniref:RNA polymerase sigma factor n=1 Tax=Tundrisphaera sp. TA3 TaxID=3435775 RepID=UPI003EBD1D27